MKRFIRCMLLLTLVLGLAGCSESTEENGPEISYRMEQRWLDAERQEILRVPVKEDCKAMLQYTYTTDGQAGAVLWLENGERELLMHELAATTDENYENIWEVEEITLRAGDNVFSLSAPTGEQVSCQMTLSLDEFDEDSLLTEQMDPAVLNVD